MQHARWLIPASFLAATALVPTSSGVARAEEAPACETIEVQYALGANLELADTPMGQGNGVYHIGPGTAVVRFQQKNGVPTGEAELVSYEMGEHFMVNAKTMFWKTHVKTESKTSVATDSCGVVAKAALNGNRLEWKSEVRARTDGALTCDGSMCGKFGAPPPGSSALHVPTHAVRFQPWVFSPDLKSFTMVKTWMSQSESPKQTSYVALTGREVRRSCSKAPLCGAR